MKKKLITTFLFTALILSVNAQEQLTQTIRGTVIDKQTLLPLIGATIQLIDTEKTKGTTTDVDGTFRLEDIPIGRVSVQISYIGYEDVALQSLILRSGKELILNVELQESVTTIEEVVVTAEIDKKESINKMATVSARAFTVEETNRYAGALGDPARMAQNFAGVQASGDSRNDIVIRGNSPMGVLWRLDGLVIPNPNHFGALGTSGGAISILNNNLLANSDFMTGAFPAEYGNALSGVFDLRMRSGNNEKHEFTGQSGFNGFEIGAEGPLPGKGSYLAAARYSTLEIFKRLGFKLGVAATPQYKDFSFKIDIPTGTKYGRFSLFGIGGRSYIELLEENRDSTSQSYAPGNLNTYFGSNMGVIGFSHLYFFNDKTRGKFGLSAAISSETTKLDTLFENDNKEIYYGSDFRETTYNISYDLNIKFNAKNNLNSGFTGNYNYYSYIDSFRVSHNNYNTVTDHDGGAFLWQIYSQWQHRFTKDISLTAGLHYLYFEFNKTSSLEPRVGIKWNFAENQILSFGAGMHSQKQVMRFYFFKDPDDNAIETNNDLDLSKAIHGVIRYDYNFTKNMRLRLETYYQHLYNIPVNMRYDNFSMLNEGSNFYFHFLDSLENKGTGKNYGLELTLEKFFSNNYYFLITGTLYESKYKGYNEKERNTAFNGNYILNALGGAEFNLDKQARKVLTINIKGTLAGGKRYIPIDLERSRQLNTEILIYDKAFEKQYKDYMRFDFKIGFKLNGEKATQEWAVDLQNFTNRKNIFSESYNVNKKDIVTELQTGFLPMVTYRILF